MRNEGFDMVFVGIGNVKVFSCLVLVEVDLKRFLSIFFLTTCDTGDVSR